MAPTDASDCDQLTSVRLIYLTAKLQLTNSAEFRRNCPATEILVDEIKLIVAEYFFSAQHAQTNRQDVLTKATIYFHHISTFSNDPSIGYHIRDLCPNSGRTPRRKFKRRYKPVFSHYCKPPNNKNNTGLGICLIIIICQGQNQCNHDFWYSIAAVCMIACWYL